MWIELDEDRDRDRDRGVEHRVDGSVDPRGNNDRKHEYDGHGRQHSCVDIDVDSRAGDGRPPDQLPIAIGEHRLRRARGHGSLRHPELERDLGTVLRKIATKIASGAHQAPVTIEIDTVRDALGRQRHFQESAVRTAVPGVATGLAVTAAGGDVLFVEATAMSGKPGLTLTGQLGDVMKESAQIALSYVRGHADELNIDEHAFEEQSFHVHVPAGAIPKDGPSAGVTMVTALTSLLSNRPVHHTVGMTGEVTLQGRVLPIGGVKQKVLAAHAAGLTDLVLPERNRGDLDDVPEEVREAMKFHFAMTIDKVLAVALEPAAVQPTAA